MSGKPPACDLSLIIATRNRAESLSRTLESISHCDYGGRWEVLVIDNGSSDKTADVLRTFTGRLPLVSLAEAEPGKNRALNRALQHARGELLVFTDDDVLVPSHWLDAFANAARDWPDFNIFGGPIQPRFPEETPSWISSPDFILASEAFGAKPRVQEGVASEPPYGANMAMRASLLKTARYNESIGPGPTRRYAQGSEYELLKRLAGRGERFIHVPGASLEHVISPEQIEVDWLLGRAERVGRGSARIKGKHLPRNIYGWAGLHLRLQKSRWQAFRSRESSPEEYFNRLQRVYYWRGYIAEARAMAARRA